MNRNEKNKVQELDKLLKSKKALETKNSKIKRSLNFTAFKNQYKKKKAMSHIMEKIDIVQHKIKKLVSEL